MYDVVVLRRLLKKVPVGYKLKSNVFGKLSLYDRHNKYLGYFCSKTTAFTLHEPLPKKKRIKSIAAGLGLGAGVIAIAVMLQGCSYIKYKGEKSTLVGIELGTKTALQGLVHKRTPNTFDISLDTYDKDASAEAIAAAILEGTRK